MKPNMQNAKIICDPLWGLIDITEYLPMVDVPAFQALGFKYQLGVTSLLFPSATHTRKQHSFGAFWRAERLGDRWLHRGLITKKEARLISAYALWHDIGHGPFSHVVEEVTREQWGRDHDQNGSLIVDRLQTPVEKMGIDFGEFKKLFTHENPLYRAVHDKNLGAEKLDYLARDAYFTLGEVPGVEYLALHTYFLDGELVIDEKAVDQAKAIQEFYVKMYKNVYLRKNSIIAQRLVQKMTAELLRTTPMKEEEFWALTDFGLLGHFETSQNPVVREYYRGFMERELPRTAIAFRLERYAATTEAARKPMQVFGVSGEVMQGIVRSDNFGAPSRLETVEREVERIAKLPPHTVLIVPPASIERFVPQDILIVAGGGKTAKLSEYFMDHFRALEEEGRSYMVLRVCVHPSHRTALSSPRVAGAVKEYLLTLASA